MKNICSFFILILLSPVLLKAQESGTLPPITPEAGKCYVLCIEETRFTNKTVQVLKTPGYKKLEKVAAEYKTVQEQIIVKPATKRFEYIPAVFKKVYDTVTIVDGYNKLTIKPNEFTTTTEEVVTQPGFRRFESKTVDANCKSKNPIDCKIFCYVEYPEQKTPFTIRKISAAATTKTTPVVKKTQVIIKDEIVTPPQVKEIEIPAVYKTISRKVLVKDESVREIDVAPDYESQDTKVLEKEGGLPTWEEIDCKLTDLNVLPIYYALNSALLDEDAKNVIDNKIFKLMTEKPRIKVEINSHTDCRNSSAYNLDLSQRRAESVVNYLISKGISSRRLMSKGYGENKLKEPCPDGIDCTEEQHAKNRRTEFRVVNFN